VDGKKCRSEGFKRKKVSKGPNGGRERGFGKGAGFRRGKDFGGGDQGENDVWRGGK